MNEIIIILILILLIIVKITGGKGGTSINLSLFNIQEPKRSRTKTSSESSIAKKIPKVRQVQKLLLEDNQVKKVKRKTKSLKA